ncbi:hypothetical protein [Streptomyces sp. NPDC001530]|uniref:hypothetical protein n=1 Tax=Streptomyces sp. NPDC001530 TaxID=3364582 RepID=UPI0036D17A17
MRKRTLLPAATLTTGLLTALPATTAAAAPSGLAGDTSGVPGTAEKGDRFGDRALLTHHSGDGRADLTLAAPVENSGDGVVRSLRSTTTGPTVTGATSFRPSSTGVPTTATPGHGTALNG